MHLSILIVKDLNIHKLLFRVKIFPNLCVYEIYLYFNFILYFYRYIYSEINI